AAKRERDALVRGTACGEDTATVSDRPRTAVDIDPGRSAADLARIGEAAAHRQLDAVMCASGDRRLVADRAGGIRDDDTRTAGDQSRRVADAAAIGEIDPGGEPAGAEDCRRVADRAGAA